MFLTAYWGLLLYSRRGLSRCRSLCVEAPRPQPRRRARGLHSGYNVGDPSGAGPGSTLDTDLSSWGPMSPLSLSTDHDLYGRGARWPRSLSPTRCFPSRDIAHKTRRRSASNSFGSWRMVLLVAPDRKDPESHRQSWSEKCHTVQTRAVSGDRMHLMSRPQKSIGSSVG